MPLRGSVGGPGGGGNYLKLLILLIFKYPELTLKIRNIKQQVRRIRRVRRSLSLRSPPTTRSVHCRRCRSGSQELFDHLDQDELLTIIGGVLVETTFTCSLLLGILLFKEKLFTAQYNNENLLNAEERRKKIS